MESHEKPFTACCVLEETMAGKKEIVKKKTMMALQNLRDHTKQNFSLYVMYEYMKMGYCS